MAATSGDSRGTNRRDGSILRGWLRRLGRGAGLGIALSALVGAGAAACQVEDELPPRPAVLSGAGGGVDGEGQGGGVPGVDGGTDGSPAACVDGAKKDCHITLGQHDGVLSCYNGVQVCEGGTWGPCGDGTISSQPTPLWLEPSEVDEIVDQPQNAGPPVACQNNPCDPSCQMFDENPDAGLKLDGSAPVFQWQTGDLGGYPPGLVKKGLVEPCDTAADCQFNEFCSSPISGTCSHDKCGVGKALDSACDPCVQTICAADPSCCLAPYSGVCSHDYCVTGIPLKSTCSSTCVAKICAQKPSCCDATNGAWDASCVALVPSICKKTCPTNTWSQSCVDKVYSMCGGFCQNRPGCAHDRCYSGAALDPACDPCVAQICAQMPDCCTKEWNNVCAERVKSVCGQGCPAEGDCVPWLPGQTDSKCSGIDLALGVPCNGVLPVCNHGNTTAPSGIKIIHFPANSQQYPLCAPDQTHPQMQTCFTSQPIPPGKCISVTSCNFGNGNREIMVNPPNVVANPPAPGHVNECSCQDNWSLWSGSNVSCQPPSCSSVTARTIKKVNLFVTLDRSGSMAGDRWNNTISALKSFFQDPASAGLGVALRFWPDSKPVSGCDDTKCDATACSKPLVALGTLTAQSAPADTQEKALVDALNNKQPGGNTPMSAALAGATQWAAAYQAANPNEMAVVVFITDGDPNGCDEDVTNISNIAGDAYTNSNVLTYAIGIQDATVSTINKIAQKGHTGSGFFIASNGNVETELLSAMLQIKGDNVSCDFALPNSGLYDPSNAKVTYTPTAGAPVVLQGMASAASCGSGWYYDNPVSPTRIILCPTTCQTILSDTGAKLALDLGCPGAYDPAGYSYQYQANCPSGTKVQWGFFAYDTVTPGNAYVSFQARTATTAAGLAAASLVSLGTAQASPNTQTCAMGGPAPCPVDLYGKLGNVAARNEFLELLITMNPTSDKAAAPTVKNWDITYSCPASE
jgi:hypothetical protein